ncbi:NADPH-dependent 1-acyldihydroxyacetone phosphate reductase-like [Pyrus ussuriensis x Pyrus communis]|uniref:NADPH-dependent 1-acyldihydroxyacetone phosphate reductase-like n=1 Tax=Pyrus ussuriensis x Pyrus communis TaxID=2448454 RepID=A0A5N5GQY9_9ROSA|nr:NADPH-dependent 1-acyldihydroxyacetone phosphate reductase-like [Pyrus ussuriensis x Pyrus communis]
MSTSDSKVVLVTGCAKGGIDYEYCKAFVEQKCRVFGIDFSQRMNDIDLSLSNNIDTLELDVSSDESVALAIKTIISKYGRIDVLANNAGIGSTGPLAELPLLQQVVPYIASQRSGSIVNISSVVGKVPTPWAGSYCASNKNAERCYHISHVLQVQDMDTKNYQSPEERKEMLPHFPRSNSNAHVAHNVLGPKPPKIISFGHMTSLFAVLSCTFIMYIFYDVCILVYSFGFVIVCINFYIV